MKQKERMLLDIKADTDIISMANYSYWGFQLNFAIIMQTDSVGFPAIRKALSANIFVNII